MRLSLRLLSPALAVMATAIQAAPCTEPDAATPIPDVTLEEVATGFHKPTHVTHAGDGSGRLYVVEQRGMIWIVANGKRLPEPFLDIRERVQDASGEKGLFSVAFHPRYRDNGLLYLDYTSPIGGLHSRVSRFRRAEGDRADAASETILLKIEQPYSNHNGGQIAFGPDGYLYVGMGDGGSGNDPRNYAQNPASLLGKMLRIDVERASAPLAYTIPKDNPFAGRAGYRGEIWALGLRNPWRFSFDAATGRLYLADVGQNEVEEIDVIERGGNYGWRIMEGDICTPGVSPVCDRSGFVAPIQVYRHPTGFSVTGGVVYRGTDSPALCGVYLYADYVTRRVWGLRYDGNRVTTQRELIAPGPAGKIAARLGVSTLAAISSFGTDENNEIYVVDHDGGRLLRVRAAR
jgi:glucose/arabinose dehydrogenase